MQRSHLSKVDISILIGNALDHFDTALYGFLAPVMAPLFFPHHAPVVQLILAYSLLGTSIVTHPLGAFLFGLMARWKGPAAGLSLSLMGVAAMTVLIGCLPIYDTGGCWAPVSLIFVRMMLGIFAAGEGALARLYILEGKTTKSAYHTASYYETSSVAGLILASIVVAAITAAKAPQDYWRIPFLFGGVTGLAGFYLRKNRWPLAILRPSFNLQPGVMESMTLLWREKLILLRVAAVTSLSYVTYAIPFVFMNSYVPLVTSVSFHEMMALNGFLLGFDMVAIPLLGRLISHFQPRRVMSVAASILGLSSIPLFWGLENASLTYVSFVRIWIVVWGLIYLCPLNIWLLAQYKQPEKYLLAGIGGAIGSSLVGRNTTVLALLLWHYTGYAIAPACYILLVVGFAVWGLAAPRFNRSSSLS